MAALTQADITVGSGDARICTSVNEKLSWLERGAAAATRSRGECARRAASFETVFLIFLSEIEYVGATRRSARRVPKLAGVSFGRLEEELVAQYDLVLVARRRLLLLLVRRCTCMYIGSGEASCQWYGGWGQWGDMSNETRVRGLRVGVPV